MDHVVVDVEIIKTIEETPGGWDATDKLGVAVACVWQYTDRRMRVYGPDDVQSLQERLLASDRISGYNILNFDFPVIWSIAKPVWLNDFDNNITGVKSCLRPKTDDMLRRIWVALGFNPDKFEKGMGGCKLDDIAGATLNSRKIGNGADAPKWFQAGQVQKVANYCSDDVAIERDLTDFVERYGYVIQNGRQLKIEPWKGGK